MTATKIKVAYTLFLISFSIWLFLIGLALFPAITNGKQIQFPNPIIQALFIGSTATSTIGCLLFGAHYLGLEIAPTRQIETHEKMSYTQRKLQASQVAIQDIGMIAHEEQEVIAVKKKKK